MAFCGHENGHRRGSWIKLLLIWTLFNTFSNSNRGRGFIFSTNDFKHFASFNLDVDVDVDMIVDLSCFQMHAMWTLFNSSLNTERGRGCEFIFSSIGYESKFFQPDIFTYISLSLIFIFSLWHFIWRQN